MDSTRDDLREARDHAKHALRATLKAARNALDAAIERLDEEPDGKTTADAQAGESPPRDDDPRT